MCDTDDTGPAHAPRLGVLDTNDLVGSKGPDPEPEEITDSGDPSYVDPDPDARPIRGSEA